jgi:hypothetical protein
MPNFTQTISKFQLAQKLCMEGDSPYNYVLLPPPQIRPIEITLSTFLIQGHTMYDNNMNKRKQNPENHNIFKRLFVWFFRTAG